MTVTLGLNAWHGDAAAALLIDGKLAIAIEEERLSRVKHTGGFPSLAAARCLRERGLSPSDIDDVAISRDPNANLVTKLAALARGEAPVSMLAGRAANRSRVGQVGEALAEALGGPLRAQIHHVEHHRAHLASAFFASPFDEAAVLSIDGFGDFVSTMWAAGRGTSLEVLGAVGWPHSLGLLYLAVTQWLGFPYYGDEGKVMGLAPYGRPVFVERLRRGVWPTSDGFRVDPRWFAHATSGLTMTFDGGTPVVGTAFGPGLVDELGPPRDPSAPLGSYHRDVAASLQALTEDIVLHLGRLAVRATGMRRLCLAGGVALNSVANGKLRAGAGLDDLFIQPAAGDGGTALGAALFVEHARLGRPRGFEMRHAAWGPSFDAADVDAAIARAGLASTKHADDAALCRHAARLLDEGRIIGWFQGAMELGPRALGQRSLLADPRRADMKDALNRRIKRREGFRPFAPSVLAEAAAEWFVDAQPSPTMLLVLPVRREKRAQVPAIVHVDGSGRLQTVDAADLPLYHQLISAFADITGVPMLLNTSFNENEPIVCTPDEALACFLRTGMDALFLGRTAIERAS
jgi:carbamoyltransferase